MHSYIEPTIFDSVDYNQWFKYLNTEGYVVIKDILTNEQRDEFLQLFYKDITNVSNKLNINDLNTWNKESYPGMYGKGICSFNGFGQSDFMWMLRTKNKIKNIYKQLYNVDKLITSMDGFSLFINNEQKSKQWNHIDQNPNSKIVSYQSSYNFYPVEKGDAGFIVAPQSHKLFTPVVDHSKDWILLDTDNEWNYKTVQLIIPENCLTIWNSRLIHSNIGITKSKKEINRINRITCYIAYLPRELQTEDNRLLRINAYKEGNTCSHWANKCELKRYPWGFKKKYESKGFNQLTPRLINGHIPLDRYILI